jgi:DNA-directed RNA polymerase subunit alpha
VIEKNWRDLRSPNKPVVTPLDGENTAKIVVEPLERGFGLTLGNAL